MRAWPRDEALCGLDLDRVEASNAQVDHYRQHCNCGANEHHIEPAPSLQGCASSLILLLPDFSLKVRVLDRVQGYFTSQTAFLSQGEVRGVKRQL